MRDSPKPYICALSRENCASRSDSNLENDAPCNNHPQSAASSGSCGEARRTVEIGGAGSVAIISSGCSSSSSSTNSCSRQPCELRRSRKSSKRSTASWAMQDFGDSPPSNGSLAQPHKHQLQCSKCEQTVPNHSGELAVYNSEALCGSEKGSSCTYSEIDISFVLVR